MLRPVQSTQIATTLSLLFLLCHRQQRLDQTERLAEQGVGNDQKVLKSNPEFTTAAFLRRSLD